jgi:hypothetical protein
MLGSLYFFLNCYFFMSLFIIIVYFESHFFLNYQISSPSLQKQVHYHPTSAPANQ